MGQECLRVCVGIATSCKVAFWSESGLTHCNGFGDGNQVSPMVETAVKFSDPTSIFAKGDKRPCGVFCLCGVYSFNFLGKFFS